MVIQKKWLWAIPLIAIFIGGLFLTTHNSQQVASASTQDSIQGNTVNRAGSAALGSVLTPNVCPEGQYMDLTSDACRNLVKNYGFDANQFEDSFSGTEYALTSCSESGLKDIFKRMGSAGGKIILPACTITVQNGLEIPSNVILQGAGIDRTIFRSSSSFSGNMLKAKYRKNVIVRDLSVDGRRANNAGILAWYADNVLIERVDVHHTGKSGIVFRYAQRVTIRYSSSHDQVLWHGIDSKDCFPNSSTPDSQECASDAGNVAPGVLWSQNYAIYSNRLYNNGRFGLDVHANRGEVAGNLIFKNSYGSKFPDASHVWVHRNKFADNDHWGSWVYNTVDAPEKRASKVVYFENIFSGNKEYPLYIAEPATDIYIINNRYENNSPNRLRIAPSAVYTCNGSADAALDVDGTTPRTADSGLCNVSQVAHIFGHDSNAPAPIAITIPLATATPTQQPPTPTAIAPTQEPTTAPIAPTAAAPTTVAPQPTPPPPANAPIVTVPVDEDDRLYIPAKIEAENYASGSNGVAYRDMSGGNAGNKLRTDDVDIEEANDVDGGYSIGWIEAGEWLTYNITAKQAGRYDLTLRVAAWGDYVRSVHVELNGVDVTGPIHFDGSAGHRAWTDIVVENINIDRGDHQMRLVMNQAGFNLNYINIEARDLVVEEPAPSNEAAHNVPGRIEAEAYNSGGNGSAYSDTSAGNAGSQYRTEDVDIEAVSDIDGRFNIGWIEPGEWLAYDIFVEKDGQYDISARVSTWSGAERQLHIEIDGTDVTGPMTFDASAGHRVWTNIVKNEVNLTAGRHTMRIHMDTGSFNLNYVEILEPARALFNVCDYETEARCLYDGDEAPITTIIERPIELQILDKDLFIPLFNR